MARRLTRTVGAARSRRNEPRQLREFHARFAPGMRLEGTRRVSYLDDGPGVVGPSFPLSTLAEAFGGDSEPPDVLLFADSTTLLVSRFDVSRRTLLEMVLRGLSPFRVCVVGHIAYHGAVQEALLHVVAALPAHPRVVAMPVSIRQPNVQWAANPIFQFTELIEAASSFAADPASPVPDVAAFPRGDLTRGGTHADPEEWERFRAAPVSFPGQPESTVGHFLDLIKAPPDDDVDARLERARSIFAYHYAVGSDDVRLRGLSQAVRIANGIGAKVVAHLTPINYQAGHRLLGASFDEAVSCATELVASACRNAAAPGGLVLEDLTHLLPSTEFFYDTDPTEHFDEFGRRKVAKILVRLISEALQAG